MNGWVDVQTYLCPYMYMYMCLPVVTCPCVRVCLHVEVFFFRPAASHCPKRRKAKQRRGGGGSGQSEGGSLVSQSNHPAPPSGIIKIGACLVSVGRFGWLAGWLSSCRPSASLTACPLTCQSVRRRISVCRDSLTQRGERSGRQTGKHQPTPAQQYDSEPATVCP